MLAQVAMDYSGLPDVRDITATQIRFFYESGRASLEQRTKSNT